MIQAAFLGAALACSYRYWSRMWILWKVYAILIGFGVTGLVVQRTSFAFVQLLAVVTGFVVAFRAIPRLPRSN
jgi:hypothetical protein